MSHGATDIEDDPLFCEIKQKFPDFEIPEVQYYILLDTLEQTKENDLIPTCSKIYSQHKKRGIIDYSKIPHPGAVKTIATLFDKELELKFIGTLLGLVAILCRNDANEDQMRTLGGFEFVSRSFLHESRRIKKNACWALSYLPNLEKNDADTWVNRILSVMGSHKTHNKVQKFGLYALDELLFRTGITLPQEVIQKVLEALDVFSMDQHIQECGIQTIIKFSKRGESPATPQMLERFFEALRKHPDNPHVQAAGLAALEHFADNTEFNSDWIDFPMKAMATHNNNSTVVLPALGVFCGLLRRDNKNKLVGINKKLLEITIDSIRKFEDIEIHITGCYLLRNLIHYYKIKWDTETKQLVLGILFEQMEAHQENLHIQEPRKGVPSEIYQRGLISKVVRAMENHMENENLATIGCYIFVHFAILGYKFEIAKVPKVMESIVATMMMHKKEYAQHGGSAAIWNLCYLDSTNEKDIKKVQDEIHLLIVKNGGVECLIEAVNGYTIDGNLAALSLDFIGANLGTLKGYEEKIAFTLSKYNYNTGSSNFGATMATAMGNMLGLQNSGTVTGVAPLELLAIKVLLKSDILPPSMVEQLPELLKEKVEFVSVTMKQHATTTT